MNYFGPAGHDDILHLLVQLAVLLFIARLFGEIARRFNQPAVIGEILAGVFLGGSFLSRLMPVAGTWMLPQTPLQGNLLEVVGLLGALFLLVLTGLEIDLPLIRRHLKTAFSIGFFALVIPFGTGYILAGYLPDSYLTDPGSRFQFQLFVGTALSVSALPVIAKVLLDLNLMRRNIGQTIMAVGMIDDAIAWIILSVVLALITEGTVSPAIFVLETAKILLFISVTFFAGRLVIARVFNNLLDRSSLPEKSLTLVVFSVLAFSALAQSLRIEAVLGAFLAGIIFGTFRRLPPETIQKLHGLTVGIFAPIFFAIAGLKVDLYALFNPEIAMVALIVLAVASIGKLAGAFIGARLAGKDNWHAFAFGSALNARGAVQIVIASIGLQTGILAPEMYTIIVIVAITTSVMAPFMLRYASTRLKTDDEELQRLKREQWANESPVSAFKRILMPVRLRFEGSGQTQRVAAAVINRLSNKSKLDLTLLSVTTKEFELQCQRALLTMQPMFKNPAVSSKVVISSRPAEAILDEAQRDYDVMVLGATERASSQQTSLFNPMVDYLVRTAPASTIVVQASNVELSWQPNRILVPVSGTAASRNAVDMALNLAEGPDFEIIFVHVIQEEHVESPAGNRRSFVLQEEHIGQQILQDVKKRADALRIKNTTMLRSGPSVEVTVLDVAAKNGIDLIVIGTSIRPGTDRLFLGPRVERMLYMAKCPVLIFNN